MANFTVDQDEVSLDELVKSLGTINSLKCVTLAANKQAKAHFTGDALALLCADNQFEELRLANFRLWPEQYDIISTAVALTTTLKTLRLNHVGMAQPCSVKLAAGLAQNASLTKLDLSCNNIDDVGVTALAKSLHGNTTLKHWRFWDNKQIGVAGFAALADLLEVNTTLEKLDAPNTSETEYRAKIDYLMKKNREAAIAA